MHSFIFKFIVLKKDQSPKTEKIKKYYPINMKIPGAH